MNKAEFDEALQKRMEECAAKDIFGRARLLLRQITEEAAKEKPELLDSEAHLFSRYLDEGGVRITGTKVALWISERGHEFYINARKISILGDLSAVFRAQTAGFIVRDGDPRVLETVIGKVFISRYISGIWEETLRDFDVEAIRQQRAKIQQNHKRSSRPLTTDEVEIARSFGLL